MFAFRNLVKKYLNHPWTTNFEIRHKSGSSSINLIMASFHEAVSFIDLRIFSDHISGVIHAVS